MRSVLKTSGRRWNLGWLLPLVLLALPNCMLSGGPFEGIDEEVDLAFYPGEMPTSAIMCEIPKPLAENESECATDQEIMEGISFAAAATGLATSENDPTALDWSESAMLECNGPKKKKFYGTYPDGVRVCLNCGTQIPDPYADPTQVCIAKCKDLFHADEVLLDFSGSHDALIAFCEANAKVAINVEPSTMCYPGACTEGGNPNSSWVDPRRAPEPVQWTDHIGTDDAMGTNSLERTAPTTGGTTADFNAGAASKQTISRGDAWVEFAPGDATNTSRLLGVRPSFTSDGQKCFDPTKCPDTDPHVETVGYAIYFYADGQVYVLEPGATPGTFDVYGPFGPYSADERYRIRVTDNNLNAGTASISYHRVVGGVEQPAFATNTSPAPLYPLRVDTTFLEFGAQLLDVNIVRIKQ